MPLGETRERWSERLPWQPYSEKHGCSNTPGDNPELSWPRAEHLLHVVADSIDAVEPRDGDGFEEDHDDNRVEC